MTVSRILYPKIDIYQFNKNNQLNISPLLSFTDQCPTALLLLLVDRVYVDVKIVALPELLLAVRTSEVLLAEMDHLDMAF